MFSLVICLIYASRPKDYFKGKPKYNKQYLTLKLIFNVFLSYLFNIRFAS